MPMDGRKTLMVVDVEVDAAVERDWNAWYDTVHLPEILSCPGFLSGVRYAATGAPQRYITVYRLESPAATATPEFAARRGWGPFVGRVRATVEVFEQVGT